MKTIYKYPLQTTDTQIIKLPKYAQILCVQTQNNEPYIWAKVNTEMALEEIKINIYGTGHEIPENIKEVYIGTYQIHDGSLVFHAFKEI